ncbi:hypothetical protein Hanom_Chr00s013295g01750471 [Helianthus anomalus]
MFTVRCDHLGCATCKPLCRALRGLNMGLPIWVLTFLDAPHSTLRCLERRILLE